MCFVWFSVTFASMQTSSTLEKIITALWKPFFQIPKLYFFQDFFVDFLIPPHEYLHGTEYFLINWYSLSLSTDYRLWNPKIHYRVHKSLLPVPILSQVHSVHTLAPYLPNILFNIIVPSAPTYSERPLSLRLYKQIFTHFLSSPCILHSPPMTFSLILSS
jgi:hypothetical protein